MHVQDQSTPDHAGAASTCPPSAPDLPALAAHLKQTCIGWPAYGLPFCYALDRALAHVERGAVLRRISPTAYHVQALPHAMPYRVTLGRCPCKAPGPWCYHRALVHLITALPDEVQP